MMEEMKQKLLEEINKLHERYELSKTVGPDYFEPGMMEYLDQSDGSYNPESGEIILKFEAKGVRYEGRTEQIESVHIHDPLKVVRDKENSFNSNNFTFVTEKEQNVGNMPADLCNALAPLFDEGSLVFTDVFASYVEPISKRSRHAKQAVLFIELHCQLTSE